jgi:hypothetical protein
MTLYSIYGDTDHYRNIRFDRKQSREVFGRDVHDQFDVNYEAKPYIDIWQPLDIEFDDDEPRLSGDLIPDMFEHNGRLFISQKAYDALKPLLENDGEFLPVNYDNGQDYFFNPLSIAENVDGLDVNRSIKNEWGDIENTAFHEDRVKNFMIFRCNFDNHRNAYCQEELKAAIEHAGLKGVFFTPDLGNPYTLKTAAKRRSS